ncbi:BQ2448_5980 [Microbotryum intermedium]|uniref:BQ2448_5980 protein n=1 Tax=Microbotryum intermedium TaxID=269621 RepID=A0A238F649_9BASI|nr:BQ2448_5980 [Microbotryum intermedium]
MTPTGGITPSPTPPLPTQDEEDRHHTTIEPFSVHASTSSSMNKRNENGREDGRDDTTVVDMGHSTGEQAEDDDNEVDDDDEDGVPAPSRWKQSDGREEELAFLTEDELDPEDEEIITTPRTTDPASMRPSWATESEWEEDGNDTDGPGLHRKKNRRVYGGGRHGDALKGGSLGPGEVAGMILASTLSPTPLLMPHAVALLGIGLFLSVLFLTAGLSWFSYVVTGVEARYVGSRCVYEKHRLSTHDIDSTIPMLCRSWVSLTAAVFPHRARIHKVGEMLASFAVFVGAALRAVLSVVAMSEIMVDLLFPEKKGNLWWQRVIVVCVMGVVWTVLPLVVIPLVRKKMQQSQNRAHPAFRALLQLPAYIALLLWPLALLVLGVRLKKLNAGTSFNSHTPIDGRGLTFPLPTPPGRGKMGAAGEAMGYSIWGGELGDAVLVPHDTFLFLTSLARPSSTAARRSSGSITSTSHSSPNGPVEGRRNQWPLACALGVGGATIVQLGWALVGYLGVENGGREGNVLRNASLPRGDPWLDVVRWLVVMAIAAQIEDSLAGAYSRAGKVVEAVVGKRLNVREEVAANSRARRRRSHRVGNGHTGNYAPLHYDDDEDESGARSGGLFGGARPTSWPRAISRIGVWVIVVFFGMMVCSWGDTGEGAVSVAEIAGVSVSAVGSFLAPGEFTISFQENSSVSGVADPFLLSASLQKKGLFFIALFHLRRPRSIFVSDPSSPSFTADTLLVRKEQQVQRRLSGRRIWQDVMVFGGLLPYSMVVIARGVTALVQRE